MLQNQSATTLQKLVVVEREDGKDLIVYPIPGSLEFKKTVDDTKAWQIEVSVYGVIHRSTENVEQYDEPELMVLPVEGLVVSSYLEFEEEQRRKIV